MCIRDSYLTSLHYAIVMPLLNSKSNISCCLRGTDYFGYLRWDGRHPLNIFSRRSRLSAYCRKGMTLGLCRVKIHLPSMPASRKRYIIETINDLLKNKAQLVHSRHRSITNFLVNLDVYKRQVRRMRGFRLSGRWEHRCRGCADGCRSG